MRKRQLTKSDFRLIVEKIDGKITSVHIQRLWRLHGMLGSIIYQWIDVEKSDFAGDRQTAYFTTIKEALKFAKIERKKINKRRRQITLSDVYYIP